MLMTCSKDTGAGPWLAGETKTEEVEWRWKKRKKEKEKEGYTKEEWAGANGYMGERDNAQNNHVGGADTGSRDPTLRT